jgi:hypothetical protein
MALDVMLLRKRDERPVARQASILRAVRDAATRAPPSHIARPQAKE